MTSYQTSQGVSSKLIYTHLILIQKEHPHLTKKKKRKFSFQIQRKVVNNTHTLRKSKMLTAIAYQFIAIL